MSIGAKNRLKIAIVTAFPREVGAPRGGVEAVSVNLVKALGECDDNEVHVVTIDPECTSPVTAMWGPVRIHRLPMLQRRSLLNAISVGRQQISSYLTTLTVDVVHSHDNYGLMVKPIPIPRVFTIHGFIHVDTALQGGIRSAIRSTLWRWIETRGWARQPNIISISPYVRGHLQNIARGTIYEIDNPVSDAFFSLERMDHERVVFSAACVSRLKNPLAMIKAVACLRNEGYDAQLHLAGTCHDPIYERCLMDFIGEHNLKGRILFLGNLTAEQIRAQLRSASVFALTSLHENAPLSIAEAMAAGLPVVASNRCGMPYMVRDGESGFLVDPNNPHDIARRLRQLLENAELRRSMGAKGREIALDRFHPAKVAARTREVYLQAIEDFHRK